MYVRYASFVMRVIFVLLFFLQNNFEFLYVCNLCSIKYLLVLISKHRLSRVEYRKVYDGPTDEQGGLHWCAELICTP